MAFSAKGHEVLAVDNYLRRTMALEMGSEALIPNPDLRTRAEIWHATSGKRVQVEIGDCTDDAFTSRLFQAFQPDAVIHYAEQPSAPYSMANHRAARRTINNNLNTTFNVIAGVMDHCPGCHIIKLGTMGEYGTPNIDIEEGWITVQHKGRSERFLFPRQGGSVYHTTKIMDTDLLWFYVRTYGLRVTDLMQGPVYGISTTECDADRRLVPNFHYDDVFGTVLNRFVVQAIAGVPLTVYGKGGQARGYINIRDTLQCVELAMNTPPKSGELRVLNQITEVFTVQQLAERVQNVARGVGFDVRIAPVENPRKELEEHYYNPMYSGLRDLGLKPHLMTDEVIKGMLDAIRPHKDGIDVKKIMPRVRWSKPR
jgi:UDP-sulfoquinovose synthase